MVRCLLHFSVKQKKKMQTSMVWQNLAPELILHILDYLDLMMELTTHGKLSQEQGRKRVIKMLYGYFKNESRRIYLLYRTLSMIESAVQLLPRSGNVHILLLNDISDYDMACACLTRHSHTMQQLHICSHHFGNAPLAYLMNHATSLTSLTLEVTQVNAFGLRIIADMLKNLQRFKFEMPVFEYKETEQEVQQWNMEYDVPKAIAALVALPKLQRLHIQGYTIESSVTHLVKPIDLLCFQKSSTITELILSRCMTNLYNIHGIGHLKLKILELDNMTQEDMQNMLKTCQLEHLQVLKLNDCTLNSLSFLTKMPKLKKLNLDGAAIPMKDFKDAKALVNTCLQQFKYVASYTPLIMHFLTQWDALQRVSLSGDHITNEQLELLLLKTTLKQLKVSDKTKNNPSLTMDIFQTIVDLNTSLEGLNIGDLRDQQTDGSEEEDEESQEDDYDDDESKDVVGVLGKHPTLKDIKVASHCSTTALCLLLQRYAKM